MQEAKNIFQEKSCQTSAVFAVSTLFDLVQLSQHQYNVHMTPPDSRQEVNKRKKPVSVDCVCVESKTVLTEDFHC